MAVTVVIGVYVEVDGMWTSLLGDEVGDRIGSSELYRCGERRETGGKYEQDLYGSSLRDKEEVVDDSVRGTPAWSYLLSSVKSHGLSSAYASCSSPQNHSRWRPFLCGTTDRGG